MMAVVTVTRAHLVWRGHHEVNHLHRGECVEDWDCPRDRACHHGLCRDPCTGACGYQANCRVEWTAWKFEWFYNLTFRFTIKLPTAPVLQDLLEMRWVSAMKLKKQQKTILSVDGHIVWISIFINILTFELIKGLEIIHDLFMKQWKNRSNESSDSDEDCRECVCLMDQWWLTDSVLSKNWHPHLWAESLTSDRWRLFTGGSSDSHKDYWKLKLTQSGSKSHYYTKFS